MIKKTFTITPESGSNNGSISINAEANTDTNDVQEIIVITGNGINKSINLLQKGYINVYTDWAKRVDSNWSLEGNFIFPDVFYGQQNSLQLQMQDGTHSRPNYTVPYGHAARSIPTDAESVRRLNKPK